MTTSKKTLLVFTTLLGLIFIALGIFGTSGLISNNRRASAIFEQEKKLQDKIEESNIDVNESNYSSSSIYDLKNINVDEIEGIFLADFPLSAKLAIILGVFVLFMALPVVLTLKKTKGDTKYALEVKKQKELNDKFIDLNTQDGLKRIIYVINQGGIVIIPCDTIWGICSLANDDNKFKIQRIKERDESKNLITLCDKETAKNLIGSNCPNDIYDKWPAPLTVVAKKKLSKETIAVRVPNDKLLGKIIAKTGAIYSTSVNKSGEEALNNFEQIKKKFGNKVDAIGYNNSKKLKGEESTIIDVTSVPYKILREGAIKKKDLKF